MSSRRDFIVIVASIGGLLVVLMLAATWLAPETAPDMVSAACDQAMQTAAAEPDSERADPLIIRTLSACGSGDEWLEALRRHPGAMGVKDGSYVRQLDLETACYGHESLPACR